MSSTLLRSRDGAVVLLTMNRPDKLNALDRELVGALEAAFAELSLDTTIACVVLTGAGEKSFAAGADIAAMSELSSEEARAFAAQGHRVGMLIERASFPVIAAVNGFAFGGGCEIALACDFIYASDKAKLGQPEVNLGVIPGFGGTQRLARRIGIGRARELCYTGVTICAEEALRLGLVNAVVPHAKLLGKVQEVAALIASKGRLAVAQCKRVLYTGADVPLEVANAFEVQAFSALFGTHDQREGMKAFLDKRKPAFDGT